MFSLQMGNYSRMHHACVGVFILETYMKICKAEETHFVAATGNTVANCFATYVPHDITVVSYTRWFHCEMFVPRCLLLGLSRMPPSPYSCREGSGFLHRSSKRFEVASSIALLRTGG